MKLLSPKQAAERLSLAEQTLANMRCAGGGPRFYKLGRRVAYSEADLNEWLSLRVFDNTQQAQENNP